MYTVENYWVDSTKLSFQTKELKLDKEQALKIIDHLFEKEIVKDVDALFEKQLMSEHLSSLKIQIKEIVNAINVNPILQDGQNIQSALFAEQDALSIQNIESDPYSFDKFWSLYPKKAGKAKAIIFWTKELKGNRTEIVRVWNAFYFYVIHIRDTRRKEFNQQFKDGDRFLKNYNDWIGYLDKLLPNIHEVTTKVEGCLKQVDNEELVNIEVHKLKTPIDLSSKYKAVF